MSEVSDGVHTSHCCHEHGCKYAPHEEDEASCPVMTGALRQEFPCEYCEQDEKEKDETANAIVAWLERQHEEVKRSAERAIRDNDTKAFNRRSMQSRTYKKIIEGVRGRAWKK